MEEVQHKRMSSGTWQAMPFCEQMANVGSEVERAMSWRQKNNASYSQQAFERALELLDFTIDDTKNHTKLRELLRLREVLVDYFFASNSFGLTDAAWRHYFSPFTWLARSSY